MSDFKENGPSFVEIAGQFGTTAAGTVLSFAGKLADTGIVVAGKVAESVDVEELSQDYAKAKSDLVGAASLAAFSLAGKLAGSPLGRKAVGALFAPKQNGGKHESSDPVSPVDSLVNSAIVIGSDLLDKWTNRKAS